jgi:hypothetical protein
MPARPPHQPDPEGDAEVVDAEVLPEPAGAAAMLQRTPSTAPVVRQAAAVAATSFVAGAATIVAARVLRHGGLRRRNRRRRLPVGQVVATRTFLVDVHVLAPRD